MHQLESARQIKGGRSVWSFLILLEKFANTDSFDKTKAIEYRDNAKQELAGKATFPVKVLMPYNTGSTDWTNRVQVVEQQLENLLGKDYVDIVPEGYPPTGFLDATRRSGNYALRSIQPRLRS